MAFAERVDEDRFGDTGEFYDSETCVNQRKRADGLAVAFDKHKPTGGMPRPVTPVNNLRHSQDSNTRLAQSMVKNVNENEQLIADLKGAKEVLAKRGRCTSDFNDQHGRVCLMGAVLVSMECTQKNVGGHSEWAVHPMNLDSSPRHRNALMARYQRAFRALSDHCPADSTVLGDPEYVPPGHVAVTRYNDTIATDEDIYTLLDKTLASLGGLGEE